MSNLVQGPKPTEKHCINSPEWEYLPDESWDKEYSSNSTYRFKETGEMVEFYWRDDSPTYPEWSRHYEAPDDFELAGYY